jgi:hypothetical protein
MTIFDEPKLLLEYYREQAAEFRMRHDAIFKEIQHYSWLLSVLLSSPVALLVAKQWEKNWPQDWPVLRSTLPAFAIFPFLGVVFSAIAFFVIRREYHFYNESEALLYIERTLGLTGQRGFLDGRLTKASGPDFTVADYSRRERHLGTVVPWKARIRTLFLSGFVVFGLVGLFEIGVILWLLRH